MVWIHCASLGEFEQGRPVLERIRAEYPNTFILLTFFSPSGYEVRKNYPVADAVMYLPADTRQNAEWFLETVRPALAVFVKYDFWPELLKEIGRRRIRAISVASVFRKNQIYFRWYGGFFRDGLRVFTHFLVQEAGSAKLLESIGITSATVAGDTRFDRVLAVQQQAQDWPQVRRFVGEKRVMVLGSTWPEDMQVLAGFIREHQHNFRFVVVPHHTDDQTIRETENMLSVPVVRWSAWENAPADADPGPVLLIDKIGMLSALYRYGHYAWIGGAFGKGLHNTLEAAVYDIPVFFGNNNYLKFREAVGLMDAGGAFAISSTEEFTAHIRHFEDSPQDYERASKQAGNYVRNNAGATARVMEVVRQILKR